jgi:hypothetical protein
MSKMKELYTAAQDFIALGKQIEELEAQRKAMREELAELMEPGSEVEYDGQRYAWEEYMRSSTSWKALYAQAYGMLDDTAQVVMGENQRKATKETGPHYKFSRVKDDA